MNDRYLFIKVALIVMVTGAHVLVDFLGGNSLNWLSYLWLLLGMGVGVGILWADVHSLHRYYLEESHPTDGFMTRSVVFMLTLLPLGVFVVSSTGSRLGVGVLLGIMTGLCVEMWSMKHDSTAFHRFFLFQLKKRLSEKQIEQFVYVCIAFTSGTLLLSL